MSLTLRDVYVFEPTSTCGHEGCVEEDRRRLEEESRAGSLADLVEVLQAEGAEVVDSGWLATWPPSRYLVLPLEDTPK